MGTKFSHNKRMNVGLLGEFLVRRVASTVLEGDRISCAKAIGVFRRYFSPGKLLARDREIFDVVARTRGLSSDVARRFLDEMRTYATTEIDLARNDRKKAALVREVIRDFGPEFFTVHRIPEYRLYATIHMLLEMYRRPHGPTASVIRLRLEEELIRRMTSPADQVLESPRGDRIDGLVASLAMRKFEERYSGAMSEDQKRVLRNFMNYSMTGDRERFGREMGEERTALIGMISEDRTDSCFSDDPVMAGRMDEALGRLHKMSDLTTETAVQDLLLYHRLSREVRSDE